MELPAPLRSAVDQMLQGEPLERIAKASAILSDRYRREVRDGRFHIDDGLAAKAYLATRLPATFELKRSKYCVKVLDLNTNKAMLYPEAVLKSIQTTVAQ